MEPFNHSIGHQVISTCLALFLWNYKAPSNECFSLSSSIERCMCHKMSGWLWCHFQAVPQSLPCLLMRFTLHWGSNPLQFTRCTSRDLMIILTLVYLSTYFPEFLCWSFLDLVFPGSLPLSILHESRFKYNWLFLTPSASLESTWTASLVDSHHLLTSHRNLRLGSTIFIPLSGAQPRLIQRDILSKDVIGCTPQGSLC